MKKTVEPIIPHWWDWTSTALLFILLHMTAWRLTVTEWTPFLHLVQLSASLGLFFGLALGYSDFSARASRWLVFFYMLVLLPIQWITIIEDEVALEEKLSSVGGRLLVSITDFFSGRPVDDAIFFIAVMTIVFWVLSASAGFHLTRHRNFLAIISPSLVTILLLQSYDNRIASRLWILGIFILMALFLLGRLNFLREQRRWREKRVFLSPENTFDLTSTMVLAAGLIVLTSWTVPTSRTEVDAFKDTWNKLTKPWRAFTERMENAVSALDSPSNGIPGEFFGSQLALGLGFPLSDVVMFQVETPALENEVQPPRYYWRGRVYDQFINDGWFTSGTTSVEFSPIDSTPAILIAQQNPPARFTFKIREAGTSLIYAPSQPVWLSRPGLIASSPAGEQIEIASWKASPSLLPGETYETDVMLSNPNIKELREAGIEYPDWVSEKYLQLPADFSSRIEDLAKQLTADAETPYDKAVLITRYLRANIEYSETVPRPPRNADPLEWVVFEHRKAFCMYYATTEVLMLRSVGVPARLAVGFSQGTKVSKENTEDATRTFVVRKKDAHAWPEVYFPGIGWVEFEPTGNQAPLDRPLPPRDPNEPASTGPIQEVLTDDLNGGFTSRDPGLEEGIDTSASQTATPLSPFSLILILVAIAAPAIFISRRYDLPTRIPSLVRSTIERSGIESPGWILNWERWVKLSPIERAFDSVNFGLRQLKEEPPLHATPAERAGKLVSLLPEVEPGVIMLLDEHQTSLYTSRTADVRRARRAAIKIRTQVVLARLRRYWTGYYTIKP